MTLGTVCSLGSGPSGPQLAFSMFPQWKAILLPGLAQVGTPWRQTDEGLTTGLEGRWRESLGRLRRASPHIDPDGFSAGVWETSLSFALSWDTASTRPVGWGSRCYWREEKQDSVLLPTGDEPGPCKGDCVLDTRKLKPGLNVQTPESYMVYKQCCVSKTILYNERSAYPDGLKFFNPSAIYFPDKVLGDS